jgi:hypothetical protein
MQRSSEHGAWSKTGRALGIAAAVLCATALSQPNLAYAGPHGGGGGFHGGGFGGFFTVVDFTVVDFTRWERSMAADLMDFTGTGSTGVGSAGIDFTMAGSTTADFTITGFFSADRSPIRGGAIFRTMAITTTAMANPIPRRPGITVRIRPVITLM